MTKYQQRFVKLDSMTASLVEMIREVLFYTTGTKALPKHAYGTHYTNKPKTRLKSIEILKMINYSFLQRKSRRNEKRRQRKEITNH